MFLTHWIWKFHKLSYLLPTHLSLENCYSSASWCSKIAQQWCFFHFSNQTFLPLVHLTISHLSLNASFRDADHTHYTHIISLKKLWKYSSLSALWLWHQRHSLTPSGSSSPHNSLPSQWDRGENWKGRKARKLMV